VRDRGSCAGADLATRASPRWGAPVAQAAQQGDKRDGVAATPYGYRVLAPKASSVILSDLQADLVIEQARLSSLELKYFDIELVL
jgi:hypothetical protein